ncbi:transposase domain-containing protein, partial [Frankia sp. Cpl3]|nr:transposase domain-containing protein [Frankia sp. Cpl3]
RFGCWDAGWEPPTAGAVTQARKRLGRAVLAEVFERVAGPVASEVTRGAWLAGQRLLAIDGFDLDVADSQENGAEFGYGALRTELECVISRSRGRCIGGDGL